MGPSSAAISEQHLYFKYSYEEVNSNPLQKVFAAMKHISENKTAIFLFEMQGQRLCYLRVIISKSLVRLI